MKEGDYYIGDLCYVILTWEELKEVKW